MITHGIVLDTITNRIFTRIGWQWGWQWEYYEQWLFVIFFDPIGINAMLIGSRGKLYATTCDVWLLATVCLAWLRNSGSIAEGPFISPCISDRSLISYSCKTNVEASLMDSNIVECKDV